jgi:hypothetical protein
MSAPAYNCPKCNGSYFKVWKLPHPLIVHWVLNPGLAFNEVVLGQRVPKLQLLCRTCQVAAMDRAYVPCPHCGCMHLGRLWSGKRAFGNWRGISCPVCGAAIPCLWNAFSLLILAVTSPIWALPYLLYFKRKPLRPMYELVDGVSPKPRVITAKTWIVMGATWGGLTCLIMSLVHWLRHTERETVGWALVAYLPASAIGAVISALLMWLFLGRRPQRGQR